MFSLKKTILKISTILSKRTEYSLTEVLSRKNKSQVQRQPRKFNWKFLFVKHICMIFTHVRNLKLLKNNENMLSA